MTALSPIAETEEQLLDLVAHHTGTVTGLLTPDCARWVLKLNGGNRPLSKNGVERFRNIARAGEWRLTGEPIVISSDSLLNDGQHRLTAIADTGVSVPADIRFGALREAFECAGTGRRRTSSQTLTILGVRYAVMAGSVARLLALYDLGKIGERSYRIENATIAAVAQADPNIDTICKSVHATDFMPTKSASFAFPMVLAARVAPLDLVLEFVNLTATGLTPTPHNAARTLHQRLMDAHMKKHRLLQVEIATLVARGWNAWVRNTEIRQLKVLPDDRSGKHFPPLLGPPGISR